MGYYQSIDVEPTGKERKERRKEGRKEKSHALYYRVIANH
jgi:hypothetical protein